MGVHVLVPVIFSFSLLLQRGLCEGVTKKQELALLPPRGWNSYDAFDWVINEADFLQNAEIVSKSLLSHGYEYVVVDYLWYRRRVKNAGPDSEGLDVIDEWGRLIPDPQRWHSSRGGIGFKEVAKKVHDLGLKFGIHVMRGISVQAYSANTPILDPIKGGAFEESGRIWRARDIGMTDRRCKWMQHGFMSVNTDLQAGRAFLRSLYQQYAEWGVDFVKNDCVFGEDLDIKEISIVSEVLKELDRPIVYSLSPGTIVTPDMAKQVHALVNMYRITGDDWDKWEDVRYHFNIARDVAAANLIGAEGLNGKSWPDMDMLPLGWLTDPGMSRGPHRKCNLNPAEQRTQITLWSMAKSPLMYGGDLRKIDEATLKLITNPTILEIDHFSQNNTEISDFISSKDIGSSNHVSSHSRSLKDENSPGKHVLTLTSCMDHKAKGWVIGTNDKELGQICWKNSLESEDQSPFCLDKREPLLTSHEESTQYQGKFHLLGMNTMELCLETSTNRKLTSSELEISSLVPCKKNTNQMWELNHDGTLVNSYSGLCAKKETLKATVNDAEARAWIATGRKGKIYVALFNLCTEEAMIYAKIKDLADALGLGFSSCVGTEIWSGQDIKPTEQLLSVAVGRHDCALLVLTCN
ncbi:hypothetical protein MRB53_034731 [Persea americana]|uniref:Uncharacterized protein n=1 Tax=Persea americana TaxID=3435 RepID=A0ACC2K2X2_PERAE|nr:hypothetical protein MRB53_034731 [Persea americana]|eukprot:TRINITY_DN2297_c0_g1_i3.p1 TRINITY_DN2297_c0_g1~~TRINITY_DN2297_c0_g1_i3.p1  ORF type:complete len:635 (+),score=126.91 TRINITY_DN2297_c0_g1_i3:331-2235(+)